MNVLDRAWQAVDPYVPDLDIVRNWVQEHPAATRIANMTTLSSGIGLLNYFLFTSPARDRIAATLGIASVVTIDIALIASLYHSIVSRNTPPALPPEPLMLPIANLWSLLEQKTEEQLEGLVYIELHKISHYVSNIRCPEATAVRAIRNSFAMRYLHANIVGESITGRQFIASQIPFVDDREKFWEIVLATNSTIFDLTPADDYKTTKALQYYPDVLHELRKYCSASVILTESREHSNGRLDIYKVEINGISGRIKRFHYPHWPDLSAVSVDTLTTLVEQAEHLVPNANNPIWVHSIAGVGRTGVLITAMILKEKIECGEITKENFDTSLVDLIVALRKQRGPSFVTELVQLNLLREYALELLTQ